MGAFSSKTGRWELKTDAELRRLCVTGMRRIYPGLLPHLDEELAYSMLSSGSGVSEKELGNIVKKLGHSMDQWQLQVLQERLDVDNDGLVGFADFILFFHEQDPAVARRRGVTGSRAQNVATQNFHLNGDRQVLRREILPTLEKQKDEAPHREAKAQVPLLEDRPLTATEKQWLRLNKGAFCNHEPFLGMRRCDYFSDGAIGSGKGSFASGRRSASPEGTDGETRRNHRAPRRYPGDAVRRISTADSAAKRRDQEKQFLNYLERLYREQDAKRMQRVLVTQTQNSQMNRCGRKVTGKVTCFWRTDSGQSFSEQDVNLALDKDNHLIAVHTVKDLVKTGPRYCDRTREHLHGPKIWSTSPPRLGKPRLFKGRVSPPSVCKGSMSGGGGSAGLYDDKDDEDEGDPAFETAAFCPPPRINRARRPQTAHGNISQSTVHRSRAFSESPKDYTVLRPKPTYRFHHGSP